MFVAPAHLVTKWQADFERFFGGGLRAITAQTVREHALETDHDLWIVSLDLAAVNPAVQDAIHPDRAGWDAVVFDEAHRLTPTAASYYQAGRLLALNTPRALLMTATPHRGKEWLFRALLHLVDPDVYPPVTANEEPAQAAKPGRVHFLRRMKEDLVDFDGVTRLFKGRRATNVTVPLNPTEADFYAQALELVDRFFPAERRAARPMVYGKRAASSLYALRKRSSGAETGWVARCPPRPRLRRTRTETIRQGRRGEGHLRVVQGGEAGAQGDQRRARPPRAALRRPRARCVEVGPARPRPAWAQTGSSPATASRRSCSLSTPIPPTGSSRAFERWRFTARRYSGRDAHAVRDDIRDAFAARRLPNPRLD